MVNPLSNQPADQTVFLGLFQVTQGGTVLNDGFQAQPYWWVRSLPVWVQAWVAGSSLSDLLLSGPSHLIYCKLQLPFPSPLPCPCRWIPISAPDDADYYPKEPTIFVTSSCNIQLVDTFGGNLVTLWSSGTSESTLSNSNYDQPCSLTLQNDGNLVLNNYLLETVWVTPGNGFFNIFPAGMIQAPGFPSLQLPYNYNQKTDAYIYIDAVEQVSLSR